MPATTTSYVTTPNSEEIETAWFDLMQGELGIAHDHKLREFVQTMLDHMRTQVIQDPDGEPIDTVSSTDAARRVVAAYATLIYG